MVPDTDVINIIEEMSTKSSALEHDTASSNVREEEFQSSLSSLKEKISRTAQFLQDLKLLSQEIQDLGGDQEDKDKQIFTRRIVQVGAEIQDARDLLSILCKHRLPDRQWRLLFEAIEEPDSQNSCLSGFDVDPSVQFFGIDWERDFGRCFSLSMHVKQFEAALKEEDSEAELDLLMVNKMLRELAAIEADVLSHSEAVLRGRLSKSQRQLIFDEQLKYASIASTKPQKALPKSRSFREPSHKSRPIKYKKNKTTNLDKLTSSMSAHTLKCSSSDDEQQAMLDKKSTVVTISPVKRKNSGSFMQNVTSMFKNIR